ncbi:M23 family metallopeptidase [Longimicrobium sp.]|uniref:M23 family metallopeptidase n=1 Tax=Longimicrobium sp. TaxID=2029185 RepID=UPI002E343AD6|nr:M23 family metallopeptidase [Longimicrobium sp.]HEX6037291.1 M23 family metallopeptidase [Longimicrobium sp.]
MFQNTLRSTAVRGAFAVLALAAVANPGHAQRRLLGTPVAQPRSLVASGAGVSVAARDSESAGMLVPVEGISRAQLHDTYNQARSEGRTHHAIDIHAPRGTPALAVANGTVIKLHSGSRGGISVYLLDDDGRTRYYYAHLDGYAEGLHEGQRVERGEVIGYVGDTGNAQPGDYHLHFSVAILDSSDRWWEGRNLNPYDLLRPAR